MRCSTDEQAERSDYNTLENQKQLIKDYLSVRQRSGESTGWEMAGFYVDDGYSGKSMDRPELRRLLTDVQEGVVQAVVVYKMDRITRSLSDFFAMDRMMGENGCSLVSVKEQFDTSTPMGRATRNLLLVFAELERETNSERVRDKMYSEARMGRHLGGSTPYAFDVVDKKLVPRDDEAKVVRLIYDKYVETRSYYAVRDYINGLGHRTRIRPTKNGPVGGGKWTGQSIEKILHNPRYKGTYTYDHVEIPNHHEAIVDPETWDLAQTLKISRVRPPKPRPEGYEGHTYLLQGLIECPRCGTRMSPYMVSHRRQHHRNKPYTAYYECGRGHRYPAGEKCPVGRYNAERLEAAVLGKIAQLEADPVSLRHLLDKVDASENGSEARTRMLEVQEALRGVRGKIENLVEAVAAGTGLKAVEKRLFELEREEQALAGEALALESQVGRRREPIVVDDVRRWFRGIREILRHATPEERKKIVSGFVRKVEAKDKEAARVTYNILPELPPADLGSCLEQRWLGT